MPGLHQILPGSLAAADQIVCGFLGGSRYPHRHHLIQAQQAGHVQASRDSAFPALLIVRSVVVSGHPGAPGMAFNFLPIDGSA